MSDLPSRGNPGAAEGIPVANDGLLRHMAHELVHLFVQVLELGVPPVMPRSGVVRSTPFAVGPAAGTFTAARPRVWNGSLEERRPEAAEPLRAGVAS